MSGGPYRHRWEDTPDGGVRCRVCGYTAADVVRATTDGPGCPAGDAVARYMARDTRRPDPPASFAKAVQYLHSLPPKEETPE